MSKDFLQHQTPTILGNIYTMCASCDHTGTLTIGSHDHNRLTKMDLRKDTSYIGRTVSVAT